MHISGGASKRPPLKGDWKKNRSWLQVFYFNVFFACVSFSIIMPSLWLYLQDMGSDKTFLAWVVAIYSIGEALGSMAFGVWYNKTTPRIAQLTCIMLGVIGSVLYFMADLPKSPWMVFAGRFIQGVWTGGQQVIEQSFLAEAIDGPERTSITATLGSFAVMGFVMGPGIGALFSQVDMDIGVIHINGNSAPAWFVGAISLVMFLMTYFTFDPQYEEVTERNEEDDEEEETTEPLVEAPSKGGIAICLVLFFIHFYSFAIQETIGTPLVQELFGWGPCTEGHCPTTASTSFINALFTGAGVISLLVSLSIKYISRCCSDRTLLVSSVVIGLLGSLVMVDWDGALSIPVFLAGWSLITVAFPLGRNVTLSVYSQIIGPVPQGEYMAAMFTVGAIPRAIGPFIAVYTLNSPFSDNKVDWNVAVDGEVVGTIFEGLAPRTWLCFGFTAVLFVLALVGIFIYYDDILPHPASVGAKEEILLKSPEKSSMYKYKRVMVTPSPSLKPKPKKFYEHLSSPFLHPTHDVDEFEYVASGKSLPGVGRSLCTHIETRMDGGNGEGSGLLRSRTSISMMRETSQNNLKQLSQQYGSVDDV